MRERVRNAHSWASPQINEELGGRAEGPVSQAPQVGLITVTFQNVDRTAKRGTVQL